MSTDKLLIRTAILGASGYAGAELLRLLSHHPSVSIEALSGDRNAGEPVAAVFPHLADLALPRLSRIDQIDWAGLDLVFCALPHGTTQEVVKQIWPHGAVRVIDLSADFRLTDLDTYAAWYGHPHYAPELQPEAVYGLSEFNRPALADARLVAVPGCYPTAVLLALIPALAGDLIAPEDIIIDAKSGVTGSGRGLKLGNLYAEVAEGIHAYGVAHHRHAPEIEQELGSVSGCPMTVNFTPHLMPMNRGELITAYVRLKPGVDADRLRDRLAARFADEPFVSVVPAGVSPSTVHVRATNRCLIGVFADRIPGRAIVISVIDNLVKGAAGQAVQNMNIMHGLPETTALDLSPVFP